MATAQTSKRKAPPPIVPAKKAVAVKAKAVKAKATAKALADLGVVPEWRTLPDLKSFSYHPERGKVMGFNELCESMARLKDEIAFRKLQLEEIQDQIDIALSISGAEKVTWEDRPVQRVTSNSGSRIDPQLLLQNQVDPDVIAASTKPGTEYSYIDMGKPKVSKE